MMPDFFIQVYPENVKLMFTIFELGKILLELYISRRILPWDQKMQANLIATLREAIN